MAEVLTRDVLPSTQGAARHSARVVAHLCRILSREVRAGSERETRAREALSQLLEIEGTLAELVRALDARLADGSEDAAFESRARRVLLEDVRRRLAIDKPGYDS